LDDIHEACGARILLRLKKDSEDLRDLGGEGDSEARGSGKAYPKLRRTKRQWLTKEIGTDLIL
jgi:hypothetical protein